MKVAIVHDYLTQYGGAERVVEAISELFPDAPIYTLFYDKAKTKGRFRDKRVIESFWADVPVLGELFKRHNQLFFWAMPFAIERFSFGDYDLVISSSATYAKGARVLPPGVHICYCHTPTRYLWDDLGKYVTGFFANSFVRFVGSFFLGAVRLWDKKAARRPHFFIANSNHIAGRIEAIYKRIPDAVIFPPVDPVRSLARSCFVRGITSNEVNAGSPDVTSGLTSNGVDTARFLVESLDKPLKPQDYFLMVGRFLAYKRFDIGIEAANRLGFNLKIVGEGRERKQLVKLAGKTVEFLGWVDDSDLRDLYIGARALLLPQVEDFGIVAVEAMACGTPVIAQKTGGMLDIVADGENGVFFDSETVESLIGGIRRFENASFDPTIIRESAERFSKERFQKEFMEFIRKTTKISN